MYFLFVCLCIFAIMYLYICTFVLSPQLRQAHRFENHPGATSHDVQRFSTQRKNTQQQQQQGLLTKKRPTVFLKETSKEFKIKESFCSEDLDPKSLDVLHFLIHLSKSSLHFFTLPSLSSLSSMKSFHWSHHHHHLRMGIGYRVKLVPSPCLARGCFI